MNTLVMVTIAVAWTAILGVLAWGVATSWRNVMSDEGTLPIFGMLSRRGLVLERVEQTPEVLSAAVRRCAVCHQRARCSDWLARRVGGPAPACPNADFMELAARP
jgi:hypothetical protein